MDNLDKILIPRTVGSANHDKVREVIIRIQARIFCCSLIGIKVLILDGNLERIAHMWCGVIPAICYV